MAIDYDWTCNTCGGGNAAGTDTCGSCGRTAMAPTTPLTGAQMLGRSFLFVAMVVVRFLLLGFSPPDLAWWVGVGITAAFLILLGLLKLPDRRKCHLTIVGGCRETR